MAEVLNLITNTLPIDLHLKRRAAEDLCRIASRDNDVINAQFDAWDDWFNNNDGEERRCSSFRKMTMAYSHITKHDFCTPEKVSLFHAKISPLDNLKIIMESVEKEAQIKNINNLVNSGKFDYIVSTDGSSFPKDGSRLGKTGAAAIIWHKTDDCLNTLSTPVSCMSNNYEGELVGINLGLSFIDGQNIQNSDILVLCDCIPAITASFSDNSHIDKEYNQVIQGNKLLVRDIINKNNKLNCSWVPGHCNIKINELADIAAKSAAQGCSSVEDKKPDRRNLFIEISEQIVKNNWQFRINQILSDHRVFSINSQAGGWKLHKQVMWHDKYKIMKQLVSGHHDLGACRANIVKDQSPYCKCGEVETFEHFIFFCERYARARFDWSQEVAEILGTGSVPIKLVPLQTLFGQREKEKSEEDLKLCHSFLTFLENSKRFK